MKAPKIYYLANKLSKLKHIISYYYNSGFPMVYDKVLAREIKELQDDNIIDEHLKFSDKFKTVISSVQKGKDIENFSIDELKMVAARRDEWLPN